MTRAAEEGQFRPKCVLFDSWHSSIENPTLIHSLEWHGCTRFKFNRLVDPNHTHNRPSPRLIFLRKEEWFTCANTGSSIYSELFILMEILNTGPEKSLMLLNLTENHSKILVGISKYTTAVLSSAAVSRDARDVKKMSSVAIFSFRASHSSIWKLNA